MGGHLGIRAVEHRKIQIGSHKIRYVTYAPNQERVIDINKIDGTTGIFHWKSETDCHRH